MEDDMMFDACVAGEPLKIKKNPWVKWFAWYPVKINNNIEWFKYVYRQEIPKTYVTYDDWTRYNYGTIFDVLKDEK